MRVGHALSVVAVCIGLAATPSATQRSRRPPTPPPPAAAEPPLLTGSDGLSRAYDAIFDADFEKARTLLAEACPPAPREACLVLEATRQLWRIQLDPEDRSAGFEQFLRRIDQIGHVRSPGLHSCSAVRTRATLPQTLPSVRRYFARLRNHQSK